jgi:hypothetical protein
LRRWGIGRRGTDSRRRCQQQQNHRDSQGSSATPAPAAAQVTRKMHDSSKTGGFFGLASPGRFDAVSARTAGGGLAVLPLDGALTTILAFAGF